MKARIKATGYIIEVYHDPKNPDLMIGESGLHYNKKILEIIDDPDYWTRLEHQAAIAAMQGLMTILPNIGGIEGRTPKDEIVDIATETAHALVQKMKEERK